MKILIDLQSCQSGSRFGGIGRYSMNLVQAMARNSGVHDLHILMNDIMMDGIGEIYRSLEGLIPKNNIHYFTTPGEIAEAFPKNSYRARAAEVLRENFISSLKPDIILITSLFEGLGDDVCTSIGRYTSNCHTAVILYDLIPLVEKEKYLTSDISASHYYRKIDDLKRADILLSISEFSKLEATEVIGIDPHKIINISSAVDKKFKPTNISKDYAEKLKLKYGINNKFLMYTGSFDQRKNHEFLIKAFAKLPSTLRKDYQLLIVGNGWDGIYSHLKWVAGEVGLQDNEIILTGKIPDEDLLPLYNLSSLFVFPSLREGFGLPVLEAMSCGIPVIGSNTTSVPEVLGIEKALFDPSNIDSISQKILEVLSDTDLQKDLIKHGIEHSKNFSWDASAKRTIEAFEKFYEQNNLRNKLALPTSSTTEIIKTLTSLPGFHTASNDDLHQISIGLETIENNTKDNEFSYTKSKIGIVTSWNTKCGIAMYSKYLTKHSFDDYFILAPYANGNTTHPDEPNVIRCWHQGDDNLEQLIATIQNNKIENILIEFNYGFFDFKKLNLFIHKLAIIGVRISITLHSTNDPDGYEDKKLIFIKDGLSICHNIYIHSKNDIENLESIGITKNVKLLPQGIYEKESNKLNLRVDSNSFIIASYGFFLPHKGFLELIDAIKILNDENINIYLLMVNAQYDVPISVELIKAAREKIYKYGLENQISLITDFLSEDMSLNILENSDLIIFPYQETGESSSAAVRMGIASGVPVAVTPLQIFDDVKNIVMQLPGSSPLGIATGIKSIMSKIINKSHEIREITQLAKNWQVENSFKNIEIRLRKELNS